MMNPKAVEALQKAKALFAQPADDIPESTTQPVEPLRKPRVVLIPSNAPKFSKESMKQENKAQALARVMQENGITPPPIVEGQSVNYATMSVAKAVELCLAKGIKKPQAIAKETGKKVEQIYTALWQIKKRKRKAKLQAKAEFKMPTSLSKADDLLARKRAFEVKSNWETPSWEAPSDDFDPRREPTAWEDAHMVVLKSREEYEKEIDRICEERNKLEKENAELKAVIKYLERKVMV